MLARGRASPPQMRRTFQADRGNQYPSPASGTLPSFTSSNRTWREPNWDLSFGVWRENVIRCRRDVVACGAALCVMPLRWLAGLRGRRERAGGGLVLERGVAPAVRVRKSPGVFLDHLDCEKVARHRVGTARRKRRSSDLLGSPLNFRDLGALGERPAISGNTRFIRGDHHGIRNDESHDVGGVGVTRADRLPVFVPP